MKPAGVLLLCQNPPSPRKLPELFSETRSPFKKIPLVSVIIPTFNRERFLPRAMRSVLEQSFRDLELLVVDDGSTDGTGEIVKSLGDSRTRYFHQQNRGVSSSRHLGIKEGKRKFCSCLDSDDEWLPRKLERQIEFLEENPGYDAVHTDELWIRNGRKINQKKIHRKYGGWIFPHCLPLCVISPSSIMLNREIFNETGFFREDFPVCEDYEFWLRLASSRPILFINEALVIKYGGHKGQLSRKYWGMDRFRVQALRINIASGILSPLQKKQAEKELVKKCLILEKGFRKRGKIEEAERYLSLAHSSIDQS